MLNKCCLEKDNCFRQITLHVFSISSYIIVTISLLIDITISVNELDLLFKVCMLKVACHCSMRCSVTFRFYNYIQYGTPHILL